MKRKLFTWLAIAMSFTNLMAQDPQFSQFYANPLYLNPAFAGTNICGRLSMNFRDQWPAIQGTYVTYSASYDQHFNNFGGLGFLVTSDNAAKGTIITNRVGLMYAYQQNILQDLSFSVALQLDVEQKNLGTNGQLFGDRIDPKTGPGNIYGEVVPATTITYPDFSAGAVVYGNYYQAGFAAHHLLKPNQSLMNGQSLLPTKFTAHAGLIIPLPENKPRYARSGSYISPQAIYQQQQDFTELNLGFYAKKGPITGGLWYRTRDAIIVSVGIQKNAFRFAYSYDVTLSKLGFSTLGSHELSAGYRFKCVNKAKKIKYLECPGFG